MPVRTYDPAQIIVTFLGNVITGYADGTMVSVDRNEDAFSLQVGSAGESARVRSQNKSGTITLTLMSSSPSNDILSAAAAADELAGVGVGAAMIKDNFGTTVCSAQNAWIRKMPTIEFGKEVGTREWIIECDKLTMTAGGTL